MRPTLTRSAASWPEAVAARPSGAATRAGSSYATQPRRCAGAGLTGARVAAAGGVTRPAGGRLRHEGRAPGSRRFPPRGDLRSEPQSVDRFVGCSGSREPTLVAAQGRSVRPSARRPAAPFTSATPGQAAEAEHPDGEPDDPQHRERPHDDRRRSSAAGPDDRRAQRQTALVGRRRSFAHALVSSVAMGPRSQRIMPTIAARRRTDLRRFCSFFTFAPARLRR